LGTLQDVVPTTTAVRAIRLARRLSARPGDAGRCRTGRASGPPGLPGRAWRRQARPRPGARSANRPGLEGGL